MIEKQRVSQGRSEPQRAPKRPAEVDKRPHDNGKRPKIDSLPDGKSDGKAKKKERSPPKVLQRDSSHSPHSNESSDSCEHLRLTNAQSDMVKFEASTASGTSGNTSVDDDYELQNEANLPDVDGE